MKLPSKGEGRSVAPQAGRPLWSADQWAQPQATAFGMDLYWTFPGVLPRASPTVMSVWCSGGPSNPCDVYVAMRDWMACLLLGSRDMIFLYFQPKF